MRGSSIGQGADRGARPPSAEVLHAQSRGRLALVGAVPDHLAVAAGMEGTVRRLDIGPGPALNRFRGAQPRGVAYLHDTAGRPLGARSPLSPENQPASPSSLRRGACRHGGRDAFRGRPARVEGPVRNPRRPACEPIGRRTCAMESMVSSTTASSGAARTLCRILTRGTTRSTCSTRDRECSEDTGASHLPRPRWDSAGGRPGRRLAARSARPLPVQCEPGTAGDARGRRALAGRCSAREGAPQRLPTLSRYAAKAACRHRFKRPSRLAIASPGQERRNALSPVAAGAGHQALRPEWLPREMSGAEPETSSRNSGSLVILKVLVTIQSDQEKVPTGPKNLRPYTGGSAEAVRPGPSRGNGWRGMADISTDKAAAGGLCKPELEKSHCRPSY